MRNADPYPKGLVFLSSFTLNRMERPCPQMKRAGIVYCHVFHWLTSSHASLTLVVTLVNLFTCQSNSGGHTG